MDIYNNLLLGERIIAIFNNMRTLKFKTKLTITFYAAVTIIQKQKQANAANGSKSANHEPGA